MKPTALLCVAVTASIVIGGCSKTESKKTEGTRIPSSEEPAAHPTAVGTGGAAASVKSDAEFARDVALMDMNEIELSRLALQKASSPGVKTFAQQLIDEDGAAGSALKSIVAGSVDWPGQLDEKDENALIPDPYLGHRPHNRRIVESLHTSTLPTPLLASDREFSESRIHRFRDSPIQD